MIEVEITDEMIKEAKVHAKSLGKLNNSIRGGDGNLCGFLGEMCLVKHFGSLIKAEHSYDHDLRMGEFRLEIKTKDRTVVPEEHYDASIASANTGQDTDFYVFVSLLRHEDKYIRGYICGFMSPKEYYKKAKLINKGDIDPSNGWKSKMTCWNLSINKLHKF